MPLYNDNNYFLTAIEARVGARKNLIIFNEVRAIEEGILNAIELGQLSVNVENTYMTDTTTVFPVQNISSVNITTNVFNTATPHGLSNGDIVRFQSTGLYPSPITFSRVYYVRVVTPTSFSLTLTLQDALSGTNIIDILSTGTGTLQFRKQSQSMLYFLVWKEIYKDRVLFDQMEVVINYFKRLGYGINRKTNQSTNVTFYWEILW
ncbi:MAG: hypothetical protein NZZ41_00280 [Candidatus Dojkabacteria bacterium]|nr:hypothetical protein [Candidatus Dojkabacteria bacterium]